MRQLAERSLATIFAAAVVAALYLALYWSAPYWMRGSDSNGAVQAESLCAKTPSCTRVDLLLAFDSDARRPVYRATAHLRQGGNAQAITAGLRRVLDNALEIQPLPIRWMLSNNGTAVQVTYER